jgi:hypothetical protein
MVLKRLASTQSVLGTWAPSLEFVFFHGFFASQQHHTDYGFVASQPKCCTYRVETAELDRDCCQILSEPSLVLQIASRDVFSCEERAFITEKVKNSDHRKMSLKAYPKQSTVPASTMVNLSVHTDCGIAIRGPCPRETSGDGKTAVTLVGAFRIPLIGHCGFFC